MNSNKPAKLRSYTVLAIERDRTQVSRHGISRLLGGRVVAADTWFWPDTETYIAEEISREQNPGCRIVIQFNP